MQYVNAAKLNVQETLRNRIGILVDVPTSGGGNTNSGGVAERFFSTENRPVICDLIRDSEDREHFDTFLKYTNIMMSICLSTKSKSVNIDKLKQLGIDNNGKPWVYINPSLHKMCAHSWELFKMNYPQPIAEFSEQSQEHWNKFVTRFKSGTGARARQHSVKVNIKDTFTRMLQMSHPLVAVKKRSITCGICGEIGHSGRSKIHHGNDKNANTDDEILKKDILCNKI